jgi:hypothetical protein
VLFSYPGVNADIHVIPKIESADSIPNLQSIIAASDGVRSLMMAMQSFDTKRCKFVERERTCNGKMSVDFWVVVMHDKHMKEAVLRNFIR